VFTILGKEVQVLATGKEEAGFHTVNSMRTIYQAVYTIILFTQSLYGYEKVTISTIKTINAYYYNKT